MNHPTSIAPSAPTQEITLENALRDVQADARETAREDAQHSSIAKLGYRFELQRREFFKLLGGGVLVGMCVQALAQESGGGRRQSEDDLPTAMAAWLHVAADGKITVYTGKVEVGQNIRTSLSQQVAEELDRKSVV